MQIKKTLLEWYAVHQRDLPWRNTQDPYRIWISEIILQQTRVAQGWDYFLRFMERFPSVQTLAAAHEDEVMKYWQGLGYYSRARNLHAAAQQVITQFGGVFPTTYQDVKSLKGVGTYTAAAICAFAYRQPYAVVDGNVYRVLARLFGIDTPVDSTATQKQFAELAQSLIDTQHPDLYNQAIMDFGATQCTPKSPDCDACPFRKECAALRQERVETLPVKANKTAVKPLFFNYLHIQCGQQTLLHKRIAKDIWQNLYEFPLIETSTAVDFAQLSDNEAYHQLTKGVQTITLVRTTPMPTHQLSHRAIHAVFYTMTWSNIPSQLNDLAIPTAELSAYPIARLTELYLERS